MPLDDHYTVLGVSRDCSAMAARKAYRKLVLRFHPDRNPNDPLAEEQFKKVVAAYQVISDAARRAEYDGRMRAFEDARKESERTAARRREARQEMKRAEILAREARREARRQARLESEHYRSEANELDGRDLRNGMLAGAVVAVASSSVGQVPWMSLVVWLAFPAVTTPLGYYLGSAIASRLDVHLTDSLLPDVMDITARVLPGIFGWLGAWVGGRILVELGVPSTTALLLPVSLAAGAAATVGSGFGRAFTLVARRMVAKLVGVGVGATVGLVSGCLLGVVTVLFFCGLTAGDSPAFFELLLSGASASALASAAASAYGALRL